MTNRRKRYEKARNIARNSRTKADKYALKMSRQGHYGDSLKDGLAAFRDRMSRMFFRSKYKKPHQGRQEKARRVRNGQCDDPLRHAHRWAGWKSGRIVVETNGRLERCIPAP